VSGIWEKELPRHMTASKPSPRISAILSGSVSQLASSITVEEKSPDTTKIFHCALHIKYPTFKTAL
jgi:hypothetical protein